MNWYVLQVLTGTETETGDALRQIGIETLVPLENRTIHMRGGWTQRDYVLFPGYVFLRADYTAELHHRVTALAAVVRILADGSGVPVPLTEAETTQITFLAANLREPSVVELLGQGAMYRVVSGALLPLRDKIVKLDRHRRRAIVETVLAGEPLRITFSVTFQRGFQNVCTLSG